MAKIIKDTDTVVDGVNEFVRNNPHVDLLYANFEKLKAQGVLNWEAANGDLHLEALKIHQRLLRVHGSSNVANSLMRCGYTSANQIALLTENRFIKDHIQELGVSEEQMRQIHRKAVHIKNKTLHMWANVKSLVDAPHFKTMRGTNVSPEISQYFESLPSYQELFGSLDYCQCDECKSIFGPAAYFVDLMRIIDKYITEPNKETIPPDLQLEARRPDIGKIPLTCAKTNDLVPYIQIVNERLVDSVRYSLELPKGQDPFQFLATAHFPFNLPLNLPLNKIRIYLNQARLTLIDIYSLWGVDQTAITREKLGISLEEYKLFITSAAEDPSSYYGVSVADLDSVSRVEKFLQQTDVAFEDLATLLTQGLSADEINTTPSIACNFYINGGFQKTYLKIDLGTDKVPATIVNLKGNKDGFDRLNRFIRLANRLGWSYEELDWALRTTTGSGSIIMIGKDQLKGLALIQDFAKQWNIDVISVCALVNRLKTYGVGDGENSQALFDIIFNNPKILRGQEPYHPTGEPLNPLYKDPVKSWTPAGTDKNNIQLTAWLSGSLSISGNDLNLLSNAMFNGGNNIDLTVENLSILYRHSKLASLLKLSMEQYLILINLCNYAGKTVFKFEDLVYLFKIKQWMNTSGLNVYALRYFLSNGDPRPYIDPLYPFDDDTKISAWITAIQKTFSNNQSSQNGIDYITDQLANYFRSTYALINSLMPIISKSLSLPTGCKTWQEAFLITAKPPSKAPPYLAYIKEVFSWISRWLTLVNKLSLTSDVVNSLASYPQAYGFDPVFTESKYTIDNIKDLDTFQKLIVSLNDYDKNLIDFVDAFEEKESIDKQVAWLVKATGWDATQTKAIFPISAAITNVVTIIELLEKAFNVLTTLGAEPAFINLLQQSSEWDVSKPDNWLNFNNLADATLSKIKSQYENDQWGSIGTKLAGAVERKKRDALIYIKLHQLNSKYEDIKTLNNIYEYLLIDVQMGDETQISYVKEALNCVQLYLQRCRLRLEDGVDNLDIPPVWWEWIMNYRVWEANREIFLYPENYLVPSLRKTKTSIFKELESQLMQANVTQENVQKAYMKYMSEFSQIAKVEIVDAYYCSINDPAKGLIDTFFLFGKKATDPVSFYLCQREEGAEWSEWKEIKITINAKYITPIYAFNKLFIFWSEVKKSSSFSIDPGTKGSKSVNSDTYRLTISYSFQNLDGTWIAPQGLIIDEILAYEGSEQSINIEALPIFANLFEMDSPIWNKVYAFNVNKNNLKNQDETSNNDFEKISILYGPFLNNTGKVVSVAPIPQEVNPNQRVFDNLLYDSANDYNRAILAYNDGYMPVKKLKTLNANLQEDALLFPNEALLLTRNGIKDSVIISTAPTFTGEINNTTNSLQIIASQSVVYDNYVSELGVNYTPYTFPTEITEDSITSDVKGLSGNQPQLIYNALINQNILDQYGYVATNFKSKVDLSIILNGIGLAGEQLNQVQSLLFQSMGSLVLFQNVAKKNADLIMVKNQPGWFIYNNGDESFLLSLQPHKENNKLVSVFEKITKGATLTRPLITKNAFIVNDASSDNKILIDADTSIEITKILQANSLVDKNGFVNLSLITNKSLKSTLERLKLTLHQIKAIKNILFDYPIVFQNSFITKQISQATSNDIYVCFLTYGVIDHGSRMDMGSVTANNLSLAVGSLIQTKILTEDQIPDIYQKIQNLTSLIAYNYWNIDPNTPYKDVHDYVFDVTRLSTGAITHLNRSLTLGNIDALLSLDSQQVPVKPVMPFDRLKPSADNLNYPNAIDGAQVDFDGLYKRYFWEIFYHGPMLIASGLNSNQQFQDAKKWFEYIFNPTLAESFINAKTFSQNTDQAFNQVISSQIFSALQANKIGTPPAPIISVEGRVNLQFTSATDISFLNSLVSAVKNGLDMVRSILLRYQIARPSCHYWQFQPFRNHTLQSLIDMLSDSNPAVLAYNDDPFNPYAIADLRIGAYEKNVVMKYIDTLIQWGDNLFAQDTWESITEATMLYVYAYDLLGPKPVNLGACKTNKPLSFDDIKDYYKQKGTDIPQFLIDMENTLHAPEGNVLNLNPPGHAFNDLDTYFCVPENETFIQYWNIVEDRLYKIRHSENLKGQHRQLALFEPPINPMMLVRLAASSGNISGVGNYGNTAVPLYRFANIIEQAKSLAASLSQLGQQFLSILEKKDAEDLTLLHSTQQSEILNMTTGIRNDQITQLQQNLSAVQISLEQAKNTQSYYANLISQGLSAGEIANLEAMAIALAFNTGASILKAAASIAYAIPQLGSLFAITYGGDQLGHATEEASDVPSLGAEIANFIAQTSLTVAGYQRRTQEWNWQEQNVTFEIKNLEQQINSLQTQIDSANQELNIHKKSIQQETVIYNFLKRKFSNADLYQWLIDNMAVIYFQTYQLALDIALKAQKAYQFELNQDDASFITFNYWDSLKKGLMSGEMLSLALNQMETSFINNNVRCLEIEKTISLKLIDPEAFLKLKTTGKCDFKLTEKLFDYDFPGHYARKIKSVSISIPAIVGPYQNINATLVLKNDQLLTKIVDATTATTVVTYLLTGTGDKPTSAQGYRENWVPNQQIALSRGIDDSGMFVLDFNDARYLPFEGCGAVSSWQLSMPKNTNRFNFDALSDVIINLKYRALDGGGDFQTAVEGLLAANPYSSGLYFNLNQAFSSAWFAFMNDHSSSSSQQLVFPVSSRSFSYFNPGSVQLNSIYIRLSTAQGVKLPLLATPFITFNDPDKTIAETIGLNSDGSNSIDFSKSPIPESSFVSDWTISVDLTKLKDSGLLDKDGFLDSSKFLNLELILIYQGSIFKSQHSKPITEKIERVVNYGQR